MVGIIGDWFESENLSGNMSRISAPAIPRAARPEDPTRRGLI
jgi:hypothetical protein